MIRSIWTDGSCVSGPRGFRGPGGWAAIVEYGSEGYVLRGRQPQTTSVRMELTAVAEGLESCEDGDEAVLRFDCTALLSVREAWQNGTVPQGPDRALWRRLYTQFDRIDVDLRLLTKAHRDAIHRRAHVIAGSEVRSLPQGVLLAERRLREPFQGSATRLGVETPRRSGQPFHSVSAAARFPNATTERALRQFQSLFYKEEIAARRERKLQEKSMVYRDLVDEA